MPNELTGEGLLQLLDERIERYISRRDIAVRVRDYTEAARLDVLAQEVKSIRGLLGLYRPDAPVFPVPPPNPGVLSVLDTYDWQQAFEYASSPDRPPHDNNTSRDGFAREDVEAIHWMSEGENDGPDWLIGGQLRDGRWFFLAAGCDYTGWDCQAGGDAHVAATNDDIVRFGMGDKERVRLGIQIP